MNANTGDRGHLAFLSFFCHRHQHMIHGPIYARGMRILQHNIPSVFPFESDTLLANFLSCTIFKGDFITSFVASACLLRALCKVVSGGSVAVTQGTIEAAAVGAGLLYVNCTSDPEHSPSGTALGVDVLLGGVSRFVGSVAAS